MDPFTMMAIMSVASAGYSMYSADQQQQQMKKEQWKAEKNVMKKTSDLVANQYKKRRSESGSLLGQGSLASQAIADRGSILSSTPETRSLLGG